MQENWNNMELGKEMEGREVKKKKKRETHYLGTQHDDSSSENTS